MIGILKSAKAINSKTELEANAELKLLEQQKLRNSALAKAMTCLETIKLDSMNLDKGEGIHFLKAPSIGKTLLHTNISTTDRHSITSANYRQNFLADSESERQSKGALDYKNFYKRKL